jgi:hypothetical protein
VHVASFQLALGRLLSESLDFKVCNGCAAQDDGDVEFVCCHVVTATLVRGSNELCQFVESKTTAAVKTIVNIT